MTQSRRSAVERLGPAALVVTDRRGGASRQPWDSLNLADHVGDDPLVVAANRGAVARRLGVSGFAVVQAEHGNRVRVVAAPGTAEPGDAVVTTVPGLGLLALSADCVAGAVAAPDVPAIAVVHSGWRGLVADVAGAVVESLVGLGADPAVMAVRLGPAICPGCYEVSAQVRSAVARQAPPAFSRTAAGAPSVDLVSAITWQFERAGVRRVGSDPRCTAHDEDLYSFRRDGVTGRHAVAAVLVGSR